MSLFCCTNSVSSTWVEYIPMIISILALIFTIYVVLLSKKVEISINKFNKLCLTPIEAKFEFCSTIISNNKTSQISNHLSNLAATITDINVLLTVVKKIYPKLDINELQDISLNFTDKAFENQQFNLCSIEVDFLNMKVLMLEKIYDYSLYKEVTFLKYISL